MILIDDGRLRLGVSEIKPNRIVTKVNIGGSISDHKGVNIPGVVLPLSSLTEKDRKDIEYGVQLGVEKPRANRLTCLYFSSLLTCLPGDQLR